MSARDDFSKPVKRKLADRVRHACSNLDCEAPTMGPDSGEEKTMNIGVAAHITAAAPGGKRYDTSLTAEQRKGLSNGIWLCQSCSKLIDSDEWLFPVEKLKRWKKAAEQKCLETIVSPKFKRSSISTETSADLHFVKQLGLPANIDLQAHLKQMIDAAKADLSAFKGMPSWPSDPVDLDLKITGDQGSQRFDVLGLAAAIETFNEISVTADPGTGKTTTLLQLAEVALEENNFVAVFMPLSEWSTQNCTFFECVIKRKAFQRAEPKHLMLLAHHGRLILILDGWNELNSASRLRAIDEIKALKRDFPDIRLVISSRQKEFNNLIFGPEAHIGELSEDQQLSIAKTLRGSEAEALMDRAWRTRGVRELVAIPLYLVTLLDQTTGNELPKTKEEVLRLFVSKHEYDPKKASLLRDNFEGCHREALTAIAVEAQDTETTSVFCSRARTILTETENKLKNAGQIKEFPKPINAIDLLADLHMIVRTGGDDGSLSFQHHQFQEWYASFRVEELMNAAKSGDSTALKALREDMFNIPVWEEAILFACERLSHDSQAGAEAVAFCVLETMCIDPLLAAEMIYRSSEKVWTQIKKPIEKFVEKWHKKGIVDRALQFMVSTGRSEFEVCLWPLISNEDNPVHLPALRAGRRFRISVLGPGASERITSLSETLRKHIISEIAHESGIEGIEFATQLAKNDKSPEVQFSAVEALLFTRADRFAADILEFASDDVWIMLAKRGYSREITIPKISERLKKEEEKLLKAENSPRDKLHTILYQGKREIESGKKISSLIQEIDFSERDKHDSSNIQKAYELYPTETVTALITQLENGKAVPYGTNDYLKCSGVIVDEGPIVELVTNPKNEEKIATVAAHIVGPKTIIKLIDRLLDVNSRVKKPDGTFDKEISEEYHRLIGSISCTNANAFAKALLSYGNTKLPHEIQLLSTLIARHGDTGNRSQIVLSEGNHKNITDMIQKWAETLLTSSVATRSQFGEVARTVEMLGSPQLIPILKKLLSEDLVRKKQEYEEIAEAYKKGERTGKIRSCWNLQYSNSFAAIGNDKAIGAMKSYLRNEDFGFDAACALKSIWEKRQPTIMESKRIFQTWPDFSVVSEQRKRRSDHENSETFGFVDDILAVVNDLKTETDIDKHKRALALAGVAFSMPYSAKADIIKELCELPVHGEVKYTFLTVLVLAGEILKADVVCAGFNDLLKEAKTKKWMLEEQDGWRLKNWLRLFPFTDRPSAIFDALDLLEPRHKEPWKLRDVLSALRYAPSNDAEATLSRLANRDVRFLGMYEWLDALTQLNTFSAACKLLDLICDGSLLAEKGNHVRWNIGRKLSFLISSQEKFRAEVYKRYPHFSETPGKAIIEYAIADSVDNDGIFLLIKGYASQKKSFKETGLYTALRNALVGTRSSIEWSGMEELYSLPAANLRKELFKIAINDDDIYEAKLASECLNTIDEMRDDYGQVEFEMRHPDIKRGKPWPLIDIPLQSNQEETANIVKSTLQNIEQPHPSKPIDINKHHFDVSVSFPGEVREYVESVVSSLEALIGPNACFYDNNFKAQLARPSLDELLQDIYRKRSKLIIVFLCGKYQEKNWCGVEFKAIREILFERKNEKVMYIKMDDGEVNGVFKTDGYIDGSTHTPEEMARFIHERLLLSESID
jgi:hypothetical protein